MLARCYIALPYSFLVPKEEQFTVFEYTVGDFKLRMLPPGRSDIATPFGGTPVKGKVDQKDAVEANTLVLEVRKESFDRTADSPMDPPFDLLEAFANSFLIRYRHTQRAPHTLPLHQPYSWHLEYLNDDGTELPQAEGLVSGHFARKSSVQYAAIGKSVWDAIHELSPAFSPPPWRTLLLDALNHLPALAPAIVLGATALEVFIASTLDAVAQHNNTPTDIWVWINKRPDRRCEPSVEEQFDVLLKALTGHSLKDQLTLWEGFMQLKRARNTFVHEGKETLTRDEVAKLLQNAWSITEKVNSWLPAPLQWTDPVTSTNVEVSWHVFP